MKIALATAMLCTGLMTQGFARADVLVDQSLTRDAGQDAGAFGLSPASSDDLGQTFTPGFSLIDYASAGLNLASSTTVRARILEGSLDGSVVATSQSFSTGADGPLSYATDGLTAFTFGTPAALTPGASYVLQILVEQGSGSWIYGQLDFPVSGLAGYEGGVITERNFRGQISYGGPALDLIFATGLLATAPIPEPSPYAMTLAGLALLVLCRRVRTAS